MCIKTLKFETFFFSRRPGASRLNNIIDVTGASLYHGFLPALVRNCISSLTNQVDCGQRAFKKMKLQDSISESDDFNRSGESERSANFNDSVIDTEMEFIPQQMVATSGLDSKYPVSLTTALFSFLYHLASYQSGGEALVSCGMMESLLQVINWQGFELDHINVCIILLLVHSPFYVLIFCYSLLLELYG